MRKLVVLLSLLLCLPILCAPFGTAAEEYVSGSVWDLGDMITDEEESEVQAVLDAVNQKYGVALLFLSVESREGKGWLGSSNAFLESHDFSENGIILMVDAEESSYVYVPFGSFFSDAFNENVLYDVFASAMTKGNIADAAIAFAGYMDDYLSKNGVPDPTQTQAPAGSETSDPFVLPDHPLIVDEANLFTGSEKQLLTELYERISQKYHLVLAFVSVYGYSGYDIQDFADLYFEDHYGENGAVFVVDMKGREYAYSTSGWAINAYTEAALDELEDRMIDNLADGEYYDVAKAFADFSDELFLNLEKGDQYNGSGYAPIGSDWEYSTNRHKTAADYVTPAFVCLFIAWIIAWIIAAAMKSGLNSVRADKMAQNYVIQNSLNVTESNEVFLYSHVSKVARSNSSSSGHSHGSSVHTHSSSSGHSHGGRSGRF